MSAEHGGIADEFSPDARAVLYPGDCLEFLRACPSHTFRLIVTSPPYNLGKEYEKRLKLKHYLAQQEEVIRECARTLRPSGSVCWQVGGDGSGSRTAVDRPQPTARNE